MTFNEFVQQFDKQGSIVLVEGKRKVLDEDKAKLEALGKLLAANTERMTFRSGNAKGSDQLFTSGILALGGKRMEVIIPYRGHRKKANYANHTISLDEINLASEPDVLYQSKKYSRMGPLIEVYARGCKNRVTIKAAYILRDTLKVTGASGVAPASFGIFYDDQKKPKSGGTGHTMRICQMNGIPLIDQNTWFNWLK